MRNGIATAVAATLVISALSPLSGCGGAGGSPGPLGGSATYGSLTLGGTGTSVTGTTFRALTRLRVTGAGQAVTEWYNVDLAAGATYPYDVLIVMQDGTGATTAVTISHMISQNTASAQWLTPTLPPASQVSATATGVTFSGLGVPGYAAASTNTSLTLSGSLTF